MLNVKLVENLDDINFKDDDRPYDLDPEFEFVAVKDIKDEDGFAAEYAWYMTKDGRSKFFYDGVEDWETETEAEAKEWFDDFTGSMDVAEDDVENLDECNAVMNEESNLEETVDTRPYETKLKDMLNQGTIKYETLCEQLLAWLPDEEINRFMIANNYQVNDNIDDFNVDKLDSQDVLNDEELDSIEDLKNIELGDLDADLEPQNDDLGESFDAHDDDILLSEKDIESLKKLSDGEEPADNRESITGDKLNESAPKGSMLDELKNIKMSDYKDPLLNENNVNNNPDLSETCTMSAGSYDDEI